MRKKKTDLSGGIYAMLLSAKMPITNIELATALDSRSATVNISIKAMKEWPRVRIETVKISNVFYHTLMTSEPLTDVAPVTIELIIAGVFRDATRPLSLNGIVKASGSATLRRKSVEWAVNIMKNSGEYQIETTCIGRTPYHRLLKDGETLTQSVTKAKKFKEVRKPVSAVNMIFGGQAANAVTCHRYIQATMQ